MCEWGEIAPPLYHENVLSSRLPLKLGPFSRADYCGEGHRAWSPRRSQRLGEGNDFEIGSNSTMHIFVLIPEFGIDECRGFPGEEPLAPECGYCIQEEKRSKGTKKPSSRPSTSPARREALRADGQRGFDPLNTYELVIILSPLLSEQQNREKLDQLKGILTQNGAVVQKEDVWGKRRLAYAIEKQREGIYTQIGRAHV